MNKPLGQIKTPRFLFTCCVAALAMGGTVMTIFPHPRHVRSGDVTGRLDEDAYLRLSRRVTTGNLAGTRQLLFAIDRHAAQGDRIHWIDSKKNRLHVDWFGPSITLFRSYDAFVEDTYRSEGRRWILGSLIQHSSGIHSVEMWEGDTASAGIVAEAITELQAASSIPIRFTPTSDLQERSAETAGVPILRPDEAYGDRDEIALQPGRAVGTLRIVDDPHDARLLPTDIAVLKGTPVFLDPVAGLVTTTASTPLSHVNMLAGMWRIPNAFVRDAASRWGDLDGRMVSYVVGGEGIDVRPATETEVADAARSRRAKAPALPVPDLAYRGLPTLAESRRADSVRIGAKAANLAEVASVAGRSGGLYAVPPGFTVPFGRYQEFVVANGLQRRIDAILADPRMRTDQAHARARLQELRAAFSAGRIDPALLSSISKRRAQVIGDAGVFARSTTNGEDLPGFNGAGLYTSVPNLTGDEDVAKAIRTVWASIWNDRAFFAREAAGIDHRQMRAAVLIQKAVAAEASGVLITAEPGSAFGDEDAVTINAKIGLGERVVEGDVPAEQLVYHRQPVETVRILARSQDGEALVLDPRGGVRTVRSVPGQAVLSSVDAIRLGRSANLVKRHFGRPQDIEWAISMGRLWIVQSRPYLGTM